MTREESFAYYQGKKPCELFDVKEIRLMLPTSKIFDSYTCSAR